MKERKGYVFKEKGKWYARVTFTDSNGRRRNVRRTSESKSKANKLLKQLVSEIDASGEKTLEIWRKTFSDLADYYEEVFIKPAKYSNGQKVEGLRDYKRVRGFLKHYRKWFGTRKLNEISYENLFNFRKYRLKVPTPSGKDRSIASMNRELAYLRRMFNIALRQRWIDKNPISEGEPLILTSCERRRERILTLEEEKLLLEACDHPHRRHLKSLLIAL